MPRLRRANSLTQRRLGRDAVVALGARGDEEAPPAIREWAVELESKPKYVERRGGHALPPRALNHRSPSLPAHRQRGVILALAAQHRARARRPQSVDIVR